MYCTGPLCGVCVWSSGGCLGYFDDGGFGTHDRAGHLWTDIALASCFFFGGSGRFTKLWLRSMLLKLLMLFSESKVKWNLFRSVGSEVG